MKIANRDARKTASKIKIRFELEALLHLREREGDHSEARMIQREVHRRKSLPAEDVENRPAESSEKVMRMLD
jgi:hypothetical protein